MRNKILITLSLALLFFSRQNEKTDNKTSENSINANAPVKTDISSNSVNIDYNNLTSVTSENGLYKFDSPTGLYKLIKENEYYSEKLDSKIIVTFTETSQIDGPDAICKKMI
jgi:hypothetical protein